MRKNARKRMYEPTPTEHELRHDARLRQRALRRAERERTEGIDENDAAGRWLAANDTTIRRPV